MSPSRGTPLVFTRAIAPALLGILGAACSAQGLDAGNDNPHGPLPVDERNQIILSNDGCGNWQGLYAMLLANAGGPALAGITVNASSYATDLDANLASWRNLVSAARGSGLRGIPDPVASVSAPLMRPNDGNIATTTPNRSEGAQAILEISSRLSLAYRPVVVVVGGRLTDVADAYLLDPTVTERVVVVAALGTIAAKVGVMGSPNGELDPWADRIVAQEFRYIQVSDFYDPTTDIPSTQLANLPQNSLGDLIAAQQPSITATPTMADQVSVIAVGLPESVVAAEPVSVDSTGVFSPTVGPSLVPDANGRGFLVTDLDGAVASAHLWKMLNDPKTYGQ